MPAKTGLSVSPEKLIHSLASGWVTDEWLPSFYLQPSSQRTLSCRVVNISACHAVITETEFLFFYTLSCPSQLPSLFNHLESELTFLSLGTKLLSIKKKNISSYSLSFQFPCFPDPHPHPFHYPSGSFFSPGATFIDLLSTSSCVCRDQSDPKLLSCGSENQAHGPWCLQLCRLVMSCPSFPASFQGLRPLLSGNHQASTSLLHSPVPDFWWLFFS